MDVSIEEGTEKLSFFSALIIHPSFYPVYYYTIIPTGSMHKAVSIYDLLLLYLNPLSKKYITSFLQAFPTIKVYVLS
jgi:hypothetical protein